MAIKIIIVLAATIVILLGLGLLYWISNIVIKKIGKLKGKNEQPLTHGKNLIFKTIFFGLYLVFMVCVGMFVDNEEPTHLLKSEWFYSILFIIPSIIFGLWFLTEYVYIIFLKCKIGEKDLNKTILLNKKAKEEAKAKEAKKEAEKAKQKSLKQAEKAKQKSAGKAKVSK